MAGLGLPYVEDESMYTNSETFADASIVNIPGILSLPWCWYADRGFDALICDFMEEVIDKKTGTSIFFPHKKDCTFVHGKIYRRQFLIDNHIVWHPDVKCHEDSGYNLLAIKVAKEVRHCRIPLYLWKWRDGSICRKDPLYVLKTYTRMIYSNGWLVKDFLDRGMVEEAKFHACSLVYGTYFMLNKPIWLDPMNAKYRFETEKCFQEYYSSKFAMSGLVFCAHCGDIYRRIKWNNRGCRSTVWRCVSRLEKKECIARTIREEELQGAVARAVNDAWGRKDDVVSTLKENVRTVLEKGAERRLGKVETAIKKKQAVLLNTVEKGKLKKIEKELRSLQDKEQVLLEEVARNRELQERVEEMECFLDEQNQEVEYSEALVRRLVKKIEVYDEKISVEFKSGLVVDV